MILDYLLVVTVWVLGVIVAYLTSSANDRIVLKSLLSLIEHITDVASVALDAVAVPLYILLNLPWLWMIRIAVLVILALMVHQSPTTLLYALDSLWRRVVYPAMKIGVLDLLMVFKFVYGTFAPLYNMWIVLYTQSYTGTLKMAGKCSVGNVVSGAQLGTRGIVGFLAVSTQWAVDTSVTDNRWTRELNITEPVWNLQQAVAIQSDTAKCMCETLSDPFEIAFQVVKSPSLARGINAMLNVPLSVVQQGVSALPPYGVIPDFYRTFKYSRDVFTHFAVLIDDVMIKSAEIIMKQPLNAPRPFLFRTLSHAVNGGIEAAAVVVSTVAHVAIPIKLSNSTYMIEVTSMKYAFAELDYMADGAGGIMTWLLNTVTRSLSSQEGVVVLTDVQSRAAGNVIRWTIRAVLGVPNVALGLLNELAWKSFFSNEQNIIKTLQSFDGVWDEEFSMRGRPTLNKHVFFTSRQLVESFFEFIPSVFAPLKHSFLSAIQVVRIGVRLLLAGDQIVAGKFFDHPIDYNYGLNLTNIGKPYTGADPCGRNGGDCECNPKFSMDNCECMFVFPDDVMPAYLDTFYNSHTKWCNSLLYEFFLYEVDQLQEGVVNLMQQIRPEICDVIKFDEACPSGYVTSSTKMLCATTLTITRAIRIPMNAIRQLYANVMVTVFGFRNNHHRIEARLCELDNAIYGVLGVLPFPTHKEKIMNSIYALARAPVELFRSQQYIMDFVMDLTKDQIDWSARMRTIPCDGCDSIDFSGESSFVGKILKLVAVEIQVLFGYFITMMGAMADMFEDVQTGSGVFFRGLQNMLVTVKNILSQPLIDLIGMILQLFVDLLDFAGSGNIPTGMLDRIVSLFVKTCTLLAKVSIQILASVLKMLGPWGQLITKIMGSVCTVIEKAVDFLGIEIDMSSCSSLDDYGAPQDMPHKVMIDMFNMGWDGDSECDYMMHQYKHYKWGDMRPVEQIMVAECIDQRALAAKISSIMGVELPVDMIYNWKRKFEMMYSGAVATMVYYQHTSSVAMMHQWTALKIPLYWIPLLGKTQAMVKGVSITDFVHGFHEAMGNEPEIGILVNLFDETVNTMASAQQIWQAHNMSHSWRTPLNVTYTFGSPLPPSYALYTQVETSFAWGQNTSTRGTCALIDNFMETVEEQSVTTLAYYNDVYAPVTVPHFVNWLEGRDPWVTDFLNELEKSVKSFKFSLFIVDGRLLLPTGYVNFDVAFSSILWSGPQWINSFRLDLFVLDTKLLLPNGYMDFDLAFASPLWIGPKWSNLFFSDWQIRMPEIGYVNLDLAFSSPLWNGPKWTNLFFLNGKIWMPTGYMDLNLAFASPLWWNGPWTNLFFLNGKILMPTGYMDLNLAFASPRWNGPWTNLFFLNGKIWMPTGYMDLNLAFASPRWNGPTWDGGLEFPDGIRLPTLDDFDFSSGFPTIDLGELGKFNFDFEFDNFGLQFPDTDRLRLPTLDDFDFSSGFPTIDLGELGKFKFDFKYDNFGLAFPDGIRVPTLSDFDFSSGFPTIGEYKFDFQFNLFGLEFPDGLLRVPTFDDFEFIGGFPTLNLKVGAFKFDFEINLLDKFGLPFPDGVRMPTLSDFSFSTGFPTIPQFGMFTFTMDDIPNPFDIDVSLNEEGYSTNPRYDNPTLARSTDCAFEENFPDNITDALYCFVMANGSTPVPYFKYGMQYMLDYQFSTCTMSQITCNQSTSKRMDRMLEAFLYCFIAILVCFVFQLLLGVPTLMYIPLPLIFALIFLTHVWNWTLACYPNVPNCFADDLYAFVDKYLVPNSFCTYFPALADDCYTDNGYCHFVSGETNFQACSTVIPEFGYLWVPFFYAKQYFPDILKWFHYVIYKDVTFTTWMATLDSPVTQVETDCAQLHVLDLSFPLAALFVSLFVLPRTVSVVIRLLFKVLNMVLNIISLIYSVCLSLDQSIGYTWLEDYRYLKNRVEGLETRMNSVDTVQTTNTTGTIKATEDNNNNNVGRTGTPMVGVSPPKSFRRRLRFNR